MFEQTITCKLRYKFTDYSKWLWTTKLGNELWNENVNQSLICPELAAEYIILNCNSVQSNIESFQRFEISGIQNSLEHAVAQFISDCLPWIVMLWRRGASTIAQLFWTTANGTDHNACHFIAKSEHKLLLQNITRNYNN